MFVLKLCSCRSLKQKLICNFDLMRHCPFRELSLQAQIEGTCPGFQIKGSGAELYLSMTMSCFTNCWEFGGRCHWTATDRNSKNQLRALLIVYCVLLLYCWTKSTIVENVCANSANILEKLSQRYFKLSNTYYDYHCLKSNLSDKLQHENIGPN